MPGADELRLSPPQRALRWGAAGGIAVALASLLIWTPETLVPVKCTFRDLTGLSCLTCGLTRSLHALARGDLLASVRYHLLGPVLFAAAILIGGLWGTEAALGRLFRLPLSPATKRTVAGTLAVVWVGYWVVRIIGELRASGPG